MKKRLLAALIIMLSIFALAACTPADKVGENINFKPLTDENAFNIRQHILIYSDDATEREISAQKNLGTAIKDKCGIFLSAVTDYLKDGEEIPADSAEIVIGKTNRKEFNTLKYWDYTIRREGNRIFICGGSSAATEKAVNYFKDNFLSANGVLIPDDGYYTVIEEYKFETLTVDNIDISEFSIKTNAESEAYKIQDKIGTMIGVELPITNVKLQGKHYIVLDNSLGKITKGEINIGGGSITLKSHKNNIENIVDHFISDYLNIISPTNVNIVGGDSKIYDLDGISGMYGKNQILGVLNDIYNDPNSCIIGQQVFDEPEKYFDQVLLDTGELPGMIGFDLGCYGLNLKTALSSKWQERINYITEYAKNGGIVTISSHFDNPSDVSQFVRGNLGTVHTKEAYEKNFRDLITEGTELNRIFKQELDIDGKFLKDLRDNGVMVLWRPLHEMNGGWFWYCVSQNGIIVDESYIKDLWIYIYDYYTNELELDNLIWVYSPNVAPDSIRTTMLCYPGDEYVDLVGVDWYSNGKLEIEQEDSYLSMVEATDKIGGLCEFGPSGIISNEDPDKQKELYNCMDMLDDLYELRDMGYSFSYILMWTGVYSLNHLGESREFMATDYTLSQADVRILLDNYNVG